MELSSRFRDLREKAGLTRTALAKPKYTVSYVSQIESGRRRPSAEAMQFFSERLGVTTQFLATGRPEGLEHHLRYNLEEARLAIRRGDAAEADRIVQPVLAEATRYGLARLKAQAHVVLGDCRMLEAKLRQAIDAYEEALQGDLAGGDQGRTVVALARAYRTVGDLSYAADLVESHLNRREQGPLDPAVIAELQGVLVSINFERGDILRAERAAKRALAAADVGAPLDVRARAYWDASRVMAEARQWEEALDLARRARVLMEEMDDRRQVARLHNAYAFICLEVDPPRTREAAEHLDKAEEALADAGQPGDLAYVFTERSRLALLEDHPDAALEQADRALVHVGDDELERARCLFLRGRALAGLDRGGEAREDLREAATLFGKGGARQQEAGCWREVGELDLADGDVTAGLEALRSGLAALDPRRSRA